VAPLHRVGALLAGVWRSASTVGAWPAAALVLGVGMLVTGAFHEDGLADTADALGGAHTRERLFEILKDSRIGTFGAAALGVSFLLRAGAWVELGAGASELIFVSQCLSRFAPICLMAMLPYVSGPDAKSKAVVSAPWASLALGAFWTAAVLTLSVYLRWLSPRGSGALILASAAATALCGARFKARAGGITGDFLGATQQVVECVVCLTWLAVERP
jgi:adenosylcobinamide-GDP ribazoletransferase